MAVYGLGGLGGRSITSLAKALRGRFVSNDPVWALDREKYTMQWVAERVRAFFFEEYHRREFPKTGKDAEGQPVDKWEQMGFFVAGFSATADHAELWAVEIDASGKCPAPSLVFGENVAGTAVWAGAPEALNRLLRGISSQVYNGLAGSGIPTAELEGFLGGLPMEPLVQSAMPLQDVIDPVRYMAEVTVGFVKFIPGLRELRSRLMSRRSPSTRAFDRFSGSTTIP